LGENAHTFSEKHLTKIFNCKEVYFKYATNQQQDVNFRVIYSFIVFFSLYSGQPSVRAKGEPFLLEFSTLYSYYGNNLTFTKPAGGWWLVRGLNRGPEFQTLGHAAHYIG